MKKILVSGIQPSGDLHIGNYFGAIKQFVDMQNSGQYDIKVFLADYHALTSVSDAEKMRKKSFDLACAYLACGLDPKKVTFYRQSALPEHTELAWVLGNLVTMPWLMRAHAFKDKEAKNKEVNVGLFNYPVLMSADILMYDANVVPVGADQKQHVEMSREIARKFNQTFGETFVEPEEKIKDEVAIVPGIDGQKMSKSYGNVIPLFGGDEEVKKAVMSIVTDSKSPEDPKDPDSVVIYQLYKLVASEEERQKMETSLRNGGLGYGEAKKVLLNAFMDYFSEMKEKYAYYQSHPNKVYKILKRGEKRARKIAEKKMQDVREKIGLR